MANNEDASEKSQKKVVFQPALRQIGTTDCPICKTRVAVFITKTNRPFINCSFCSVRIFFPTLRRPGRLTPIIFWDIRFRLLCSGRPLGTTTGC